MQDKISELKKQFSDKLSKISQMDSLENLRLEFIGKKGIVTDFLKNLKNLSIEDKKTIGSTVNSFRSFVEQEITAKKEFLQNQLIENEIKHAEKFDFTLPQSRKIGTLHPITVVQREVEEVFKSMGFIIEDGFEIETEYNNFDAVNIPATHPARDMQDTYFLSNGQLLKTHTSAAQNRLMKKYGAPLKVLFPGRCFRNENLDAGHDNTFFQIEGLMIGEDVSISNLIYFMKTLLSEIFKRDVNIRLRPGFFPFVEPGFELDINCLICGGKGCSTCKNSGWIELMPCGMVHPNVLNMGGIDSEKYIGYAFGLGLTRLVMMKYGINDIRILNSGNIGSLSQFIDK